MATAVSSITFIPSMKRRYSDAFDEDDIHQQQKWHINEKRVAESSSSKLQQVWGKTMNLLRSGSKKFWNAAQAGISSTDEQQADTGTNFNTPATESNMPANGNGGQRSIKNYFNTTTSPVASTVESFSTAMDTADSPVFPCSNGNPCALVVPSNNLLHPSLASNVENYGFGGPSISKPTMPVNMMGSEAVMNRNSGAGTSMTTAGGLASLSSLRQLTLGKFGFAAPFLPRSSPDAVAQVAMPACPDCRAASQEPWYLLDPAHKCHDCDRPYCKSCLKSCFKCDQPFCAKCRMNSFQHSDCHKTVCIRCIN